MSTRQNDVSASKSAGPDFVCIGMQKAGTGWLYDQLSHHPQFWMPPLKEIHYLDREEPNFGTAYKFRRRSEKRKRGKHRGPPRRRDLEQRDLDFIAALEALRGTPRNLADYAAIFRFKNGQIAGDVTPGYSGMPEDVIAEVGRRLPELRIIQLVRDPVARLWSQLSMAARRHRFDPALVEDPDAFRAYLYLAMQKQPEDRKLVDIAKVGFPATVAQRWDRNAPALRFQHFFFDDIVSRPHELRREILAYLDADPDIAAGPSPDENRKSKHPKLPLSPEIEAVLSDFFRDELAACAKRFGGHAESWAERYRV